METEENAVTENITINFNYFIQLAIRRQLSWKSLAFMLTDLTTTLDISKQVIRILVQELEKLALKGETDTHEINLVNDNIQIEDNETNFGQPENALEYFDFSDPENEPIVSAIEDQIHEAKEEELSKSELDVQNELAQIEESETVINFPAEDFYEFIGDNENPSSVSEKHEKFEQSRKETGLYNVNEDIINDEKDKKNECTFCGKHFGDKTKRVIHERIHTGERPFECKVCQKTFIYKGSLDRHDRIHTGEKPFQCLSCKKCFNDLGILRRHERIHTGEKPYQCLKCNVSFRRSDALKLHEALTLVKHHLNAKHVKRIFLEQSI